MTCDGKAQLLREVDRLINVAGQKTLRPFLKKGFASSGHLEPCVGPSKINRQRIGAHLAGLAVNLLPLVGQACPGGIFDLIDNAVLSNGVHNRNGLGTLWKVSSLRNPSLRVGVNDRLAGTVLGKLRRESERKRGLPCPTVGVCE